MRRLIQYVMFLSLVFAKSNISQAQDNALINAAKYGNLAKLERAIKNGANLNSQSPAGMTPLIYASIQGHDKIAQHLIEAGADINAISQGNSTALMFAAMNEKADIVKRLISARAKIDIQNSHGSTALIKAVKANNPEIVGLLLEVGANVNKQDYQFVVYKNIPNKTALMYAAKNGNLSIVKALLEAGADINIKDNNGNTANHFAKTKSNNDVLQLLENASKPKFDYAYFSTGELKEMYKNAFENEEFDKAALIQDELSKRQHNPEAAKQVEGKRGSGDPLKGLNVSSADKKLEMGQYYALIMGIDEYKGAWLPLKNAVGDAKAVENLLRSKYKIDHFKSLYNEYATRQNIMNELQWLVDNVTGNDNVFVYYSGHGEYKNDLNKGYWVPVEAVTTQTHEFISNSDIQTYLSAIKSNHTLLVSDACFSGDIFRGKTTSVPFEQSSLYFNKVHGLKSRQALTSGGVEPVMDGGREGHSVFTYYLLEMLKRNEDKYFDAGQLYNAIKIPVTNNSDQTPLLQPVKNTGDEGGQFIFIRK